MNEPHDEHRTLEDSVISGAASYEESSRLCEIYDALGKPFPPGLEEHVLRRGLERWPTRVDMLKRLRLVLMAQNKPVPTELLASLATSGDGIQDYQHEAAEYHIRTALADMDAGFLPLYEKCRHCSMTSAERLFGLYKAVEYIARAGIPGAIVECGVWRGGSMMLAALTLFGIGGESRDLYLFDTYEGLPRPSPDCDFDVWGNRALDSWLPNRVDDESSYYGRAELDVVRRNMETTGYPGERVFFIKGMVERTIPFRAPEQIALFRLDTDWYASTRHELVHLYPRLSPRGVLIVDDYGHFRGARHAVDEVHCRTRIASAPAPARLHRPHCGKARLTSARTATARRMSGR